MQNLWKYYNHAAIPATEPHEDIVVDSEEIKEIFGTGVEGKKPLLIRWVTDFDCGIKTLWWYCIKDTPFNIAEIKAKRRYEINKGNKFFECRRIEPNEYKEQLFDVQKAAFEQYPLKYRPKVDKISFLNRIDDWIGKGIYVFGAFLRENNELCGYSVLYVRDKCINLSAQKTKPMYEKYAVNAALVYSILCEFETDLSKGKYISDGERNISHETAFQDYLIKYFEFRKAYCRLNIKYRPAMEIALKVAYPFRKVIFQMDFCSLIHNVVGVLRMEEIKRENI